MSQGKFYRNIILCEILSEEPLTGWSAAEMVASTVDGDNLGNHRKVLEDDLIDGKLCASLAIAAGSYPGFFGLDSDGLDEDGPITANDVLHQLIADIDQTGGIMEVDGLMVPVADPDWADLASTYENACAVIGQDVKIATEGGFE